ncbi:UDP-N-acetylmuramoyl-tripeptide--D-alanyl-D-alanine ligase [Streptomyces cinnamoneus]|uniref:UDP-N-acetylmuramoyl-tripeptide--D-alanyl-D- alanine ligase n=1 Tax=Streptomyces cinnamoneus TaxID=53446 RepID=UPI0033DEF74C
MIPLTLAEVAQATRGALDHVPDIEKLVDAPLSFDSRKVYPGGLFACLPGRTTDGHDYAEAAVAKGAVAALATRPVGVPTVIVPDVLTALADLARHVASRYSGTVVAVTGSAGKTSTKDLLAQVLKRQGPTVATERSFNNEIGFPSTVLRAEQDTRYLLVEMGARGLGHIQHLCGIARPHIAVVLGIGSAHLGEFGSREAIAKAKGEIIEALPPRGTAVLYGDDPLVRAMSQRTTARTLTFGTSSECEVRASDIAVDDQGRPSFTLSTPDAEAHVQLAVHGRHNVTNALAATAAAVAVGVPLPEITDGLSAARLVSGGRMQVTTRPDGVTVINDAFNSPPEAMMAAIQALRDIAGPRRAIAVLGEMAELGDASEHWHQEVARAVASVGVEHLVAVGGGLAELLAKTARAAGVAVTEVALVPSLLSALESILKPGDTVLVKGANALGLETIANKLAAGPN